MRERNYSTECVVLARRNFGEADRLLTVFSKHYGKLRVVAKGVRRTTSRKRGLLELFSQVKVWLVRGRNLDIIVDAQSVDGFSAWRKDLVRVGVAYHLVEVVERLTAEKQEHKEIFEFLVGALGQLGRTDYWALAPLIKSFKIKVLQELGFLEKGVGTTKDIDLYIEDLINGSLRTKKFLARLG